jgi:hypothetical protein
MPKKVPKIKEQKSYKIYGVRREEELNRLEKDDLPEPLENLLKVGGGCLMMAAPPGSGKTNFLVNLFYHENLLKDVFKGGTYFVSPTAHNDLTAKVMVDNFDLVSAEFSEELIRGIHDMIMDVPKEDREYSVLVLDDVLGLLKMNTFVNNWASRVRHLRNLLILSTQACKSIPPTCRSNISASCIFYQPSSKQLNDLTEMHSMMGGEENFLKAYHEATAEKYGFLWCCFRSMQMWAWGGTKDQPVLLYRRYDDNGNIIKNIDDDSSLNKIDSIKPQE